MMNGMNENTVNVTNQFVPETPEPIGPKKNECAKCGEFFTPPRSNTKKKFCGQLCQNRYLGSIPRHPRQLQRITKTCVVCSEEFSVPRCAENQITCGKVCSGLYRTVRDICTCVSCGTEFRAIPSDPKTYCNKRCFNAYYRGNKVSTWIEPSLRPCKGCGVMFDGSKGWQASKKFCTKECCMNYRREVGGGPRSLLVGTVSQYADGYRYVKTERFRWIPEHRIVAEAMIGRKLKRHELVHHKNGDPKDNRPENLQVLGVSQHINIHYEAERVGLRVQAGELIVFTREQVAEMNWVHPIEGMEC